MIKTECLVCISLNSVNGLDCFENLKEFDYLKREVFRKVLKRSSISLSGIYRLDFHGRRNDLCALIDCTIAMVDIEIV